MRFKTDELTTYVSRGIAPKYTDIIDGAAIVVNQKCIRDYQVNLELARLNDLSKRKVPTEKLVQKYDVLVNSTGVGTLGRVGQFLGNEANLTVDTHVTIVRPDKDVIDPLFFGYLMKSKQRLIESFATGTTGQTELSRDSIKEMEVSFVENREHQQAIGNFLLAIDRKLQLNKATNQTLEQMAQAIFKSWFVDFDPVKAKMNGEQPEGMDEATASLFPEKLVESELGLIPEGWEVKPLGDYLTIKRGGSPRPIKDFIVPEGYPWTKIADATANDNPYIFKTKEFIKEEGLKKTVYLKKGTLILSNSATPGLPRFLELDACIHDGWLHFPEKKHFTDSYLYQLFLHIRKHLVAQGNGSVFTNLKTDILRNQVVLVPPKELVDIYEKHASKFLETVKAKSIESNQLAQLRDTLLPKLLSGEIELGQAQELAEVE